MRPRWFQSSARACALATLLLARRAALPLALALVLALAPAPARAQADAYKQHMDNGIKLYQDGNYSAAVVEFQAAYELRPKASPLVNIALCQKARFNYPKAIVALETALAKHSDTMDAADKQAAASAITDMRALLAYVEVQITPPQATLLVDQEEQPAGAAAKPVPIGPGIHKIGARAEGFAVLEQTVTVASGDKTTVKLALVPDKGWVTVQAPDRRMSIAIDQRAVGVGQWAGMVAPGDHLIQIYGPGAAPFNAQILVIAGKQINVRPGVNSAPGPGLPGLPSQPSPLPRADREPAAPKRGPYGLALGAIVFPATHAPAFSNPELDFGGEYGVRLGYQVNRIAGFDFMFQHSNTKTTAAAGEGSYYRTVSNRLAVGVRVLTSSKPVRFVVAMGGGPVFDDFSFHLTEVGRTSCKANVGGKACPLIGDDLPAVSAFAYLEGALELDLDHVLLDLGFEGEFQATGSIGKDGEIFDGLPLVNLGPVVRVGYRFW